jgi:anti-sigma regulatory factor (Ser/Thr protein kinase)
MVAGSVVSGLAHMLAELVENGLAFSPPDADVEIQGRRIGDNYLIAITDQGIGMGRADLEVANERLRGEGDFITAPARFLGHYVVGRLATDMDIDVQLAPSPVTGVTARIVLPASILSEPRAVTATPGPAMPVPEVIRAADTQRALAAADPAATQVLTLPAAEPAAAGDGRIRPTKIEYVTVPGSPAGDFGPEQFDPAASAALGMDVYTFPAPVDDAERTPNGLRKRAPKARRPADAAEAAPTRTIDRPAPVADSPEAVRDRLTAFRTGMQRGSADRP